MHQAIATVEEKGQNPGQSPEIDLSRKGWRVDALSYAVSWQRQQLRRMN